MTYDPARPDGTNLTLSCPVSNSGVAETGRRYRIPARQGRAVRLEAGAEITIHNPGGNQVCDFFALIDGSPAEFLGMEQCRTTLGRIYVRTGDRLVTNRRRALVEIVEDTSKGVHDILIACCDHHRYRELGAIEYHDNCADNFRMACAAIGVTPTHVPSPFNIWMNIPVAGNGTYSFQAPVSRPGDYIVLRALLDCIAVMSACPQDMTPVNGVGVLPSDLAFEVHHP